MSADRITLQNTEIMDATTREVTFASSDAALRGTLYLPAAREAPLPAIVVTGAWTTVKEQMAGTYARELAARGLIALAFEFSGWGESAGTPRYVEDPAVKTADIRAAAAFLSTLEEVDEKRISGLGICASSGYMAAATADDDRLQKVALVAPWLHDPASAAEIYGGSENASHLIASAEAAGAADTILPAASLTDESAVMLRAPCYTEEDRGLITAYDNRFSLASWKPWLTYDGLASADRLNKPMLMIGSPSIALPTGADAYEKRMRAPLEKVWLGDDVTQFDFYDRADAVTAASDAVAGFLKT